MLFVTKFNGYKLLAQNDVTRCRKSAAGDDRGYLTIVEVPLIMIEFHRRGVLTFHQRKQALDFFDSRETGDDGMPPGAYRHPGVASDPEFEGALYEGSDHWMQFSMFDTDTDCPLIEDQTPEEVKRLCEKALLECQQLGTEYILIEVEKVPPPWPTYEKTHHNQKVALCEQLGLDPIECAEYEKQRENPQESVIAGYYALAEKQKDEQAAVERLTVRG